MNQNLILSNLPHVWILDLDGTLVKHNHYKNGEDIWLDGALDFVRNIPDSDYVLILTGRESKYKKQTLDFLKKYSIRFNNIIFDMPLGERILINDNKPSGLNCAQSLSLIRDKGLSNITIRVDNAL